jgi:hypothetical protein
VLLRCRVTFRPESFPHDLDIRELKVRERCLERAIGAVERGIVGNVEILASDLRRGEGSRLLEVGEEAIPAPA